MRARRVQPFTAQAEARASVLRGKAQGDIVPVTESRIGQLESFGVGQDKKEGLEEEEKSLGTATDCSISTNNDVEDSELDGVSSLESQQKEPLYQYQYQCGEAERLSSAEPVSGCSAPEDSLLLPAQRSDALPSMQMDYTETAASSSTSTSRQRTASDSALPSLAGPQHEGERGCSSTSHEAPCAVCRGTDSHPQHGGFQRELANTPSRQPSPSNGSYTAARVVRSNSDRIVGDFDNASTSSSITNENALTDERSRRGLYTRSNNDSSSIEDHDPDPQRQARFRWIAINRRFQITIAIVAFIFSILLFAIIVSWVVLTSSYVVTIDQSCDVPLKVYYWLFTIQLILDVFRTEIIRFFFQWDATSAQRMPCRVIAYNIAYIAYAFLVLRMGVNSVFFSPETSCDSTASAFFHASKTVVSLSLMAWFTIIFGYVVPFFVVATLLTWNGYNPAENSGSESRNEFTIFPTTTRAPAGCIERMPVVRLENFREDYPRECCICMEPFTTTGVIVETHCQHVFHKRCFREWLQQARTCPVCRTDIPNTLVSATGEESEDVPASPPNQLGIRRGTTPFVTRQDIHSEVVSMIQIMRRRDQRLRRSDSSEANITRVVELRDESSRNSLRSNQIRERTSSMEEGRLMR